MAMVNDLNVSCCLCQLAVWYVGQNNHDDHDHERKMERTCTGEGGQETKETKEHERFKASNAGHFEASNAGHLILLSCKIRVPSKFCVLVSLSMNCPKRQL